VPRVVTPGQRVSDLLPHDAPDGLRELLRSAANEGTQGARGIHEQITSMAAQRWHCVVPRILRALPLIRTWRITHADYRSLPNLQATWFVDPPYSGPPGRWYRTTLTTTDYSDLAEWCKSRQGEVIVCEAVGASWLPFRPLAMGRGIRADVVPEAIWTHGVMIGPGQRDLANRSARVSAELIHPRLPFPVVPGEPDGLQKELVHDELG
jgi:hypothetical protein